MDKNQIKFDGQKLCFVGGTLDFSTKKFSLIGNKV
jgi:hypothetical protein